MRVWEYNFRSIYFLKDVWNKLLSIPNYNKQVFSHNSALLINITSNIASEKENTKKTLKEF